MATIHFILQGKGGVGKSMLAAILYQYFKEDDYEVSGYDTGPVNSTLSSFKEFSNISQIEIMQDDGGNNIDPRKFDVLFEKLIEAPDSSQIIIDNGASSFVALGAYMSDCNILDILSETGHTVYLHTIITGGQALLDTLNGFHKLVKNFSSAKIVVWKNPYYGKLEIDGKSFEEFKIYKDSAENVHAFIDIPLGNKDLVGKDLELLFAKKQSFQAGITGSTNVIVKSRLKKYWDEMKTKINMAEIY